MHHLGLSYRKVAPNFWLQDRVQGLWRAFVDAQREPFTLVSLARRVDVRDPLQAWRKPLP